MRKKSPNKTTANTPPNVSPENLKGKEASDTTPSFYNCFPCFMNLNDHNVNEKAKDQNLSYDERINSMFSKLNTVDGLNSLSNQYKGDVIKDMRNLFTEMAKKITEYQNRDEDKANLSEAILDKVKPMIPLDGLKYILGQKIGFFLFNENNENGLHLPKIHIDQTAEIIVENFTDPEGKLLSVRTFIDNITRGANMKQGEKYSA